MRLPSSKTLRKQSKAVRVLTTAILEAGDSRAYTWLCGEGRKAAGGIRRALRAEQVAQASDRCVLWPRYHVGTVDGPIKAVWESI